MYKQLIVATLSVGFLAACSDKKSAEPAKTEAPAGPNLTQTLDVGKVEQVSVTAKGMGITPGAAINDALKTAVAQVNGVQVNALSGKFNSFEQATATLDVETARGNDSAKVTATLQSQAFAEQIITESNGLVSSFKVLAMIAPVAESSSYAVEIEASIAKFKAPADAGKIKILVAPLRSDRDTFDIGGHPVPAEQVLGAIRQKIIDTLSQTGRFVILDRQFEDELQNELNMISSGKTVNTDFAKLGQALSADMVWLGVINNLAYTKSVRKLQTSDRDLVSYAGAWSGSQRLINLATRQIAVSNTLEGAPLPVTPTTLGAKFDEASVLQGIQSDIVTKAAESILLRTFPISIVERDGNNVVLSQGGQAVRENGRYRIYLQGKEIKDPQTGQSLGNMESVCCDVVVTRVTPNLSYGTLEDVKADISNVQPGALQLRESVPTKLVVKPVSTAPSEVPASASGPAPIQAKPVTAKPAGASPKSEDW